MRKTIRTFAALAGVVQLLAVGPAFAQSSPSNYTTGYRYDAGGKVTAVISPDPDGVGPLKHAAVRNTYDGAGRLIKVEKGELASWQPDTVAPSAWTGFTIFQTVDTIYDGYGAKLRDTVSGGGVAKAVTQYSYDTADRLECTAVRMNAAVFGSLPSSACSLSTLGNDGADRITRNVYDDAGRITKIQKAYNTSWQQDYETRTYSPNGQVTSITDAGGNKASYTYDGHDRRIKWSFPSKTSVGTVSTTDYESYTYDANGNRETARKRDGRTLTFTYDALNRMTSKVVPDGCAPIQVGACPAASATRDVHYGYDLRGLQTFARFDSQTGAEALASTYDGFGRLKTSTNTMGGTSRVLTYEWDANGNRTAVTHPDGNPTTYDKAFKYEYDGLDRLVAIKENGITAIASLVYSANGTRQSLTRGGVVTTYTYDPVLRPQTLTDQLAGTASDLTTTFGYNAASQLISRQRSNTAYVFSGYVPVSRAYAANGLNQYTTAGPATFTYDANGNLTGDGTNTYVYDAENRLVSASGALSAQLIYDPMGRLFSSGAPGAGKQLLYDGDELVAEYNPAAPTTVYKRYVHGAAEDDPWFWYNGAAVSSANRLSMQADHQGSIVSIADASGAMMVLNKYDEYGIPASGNAGRFQYTGQAWLPEIGMYYYKARVYSPTLGRFLQTDPIGYEDQINLYTYVGNDPLNRTDPSGECVGPLIIPCGAAAGEVAVGAIIVTGAACYLSGACQSAGEAIQRGVEEVRNRVGQIFTQSDRTAPTSSTGPTITESRRKSPHIRCSNPTCDAPHGGSTGTTECPDCAGKRQRGYPLPGPPPRTLPSKINQSFEFQVESMRDFWMESTPKLGRRKEDIEY